MIGLREIVSPLSVDDFLSEHWCAERWMATQPPADLLSWLHHVPELKDRLHLLSKYKSTITLFGPNGFRAQSLGSEAVKFMDRGYTLYLPGVERYVPELAQLCESVARDLGVSEQASSIEAFVGTQGSTASFHYDHDTNFQILLEGQKIWRVAPNVNIVNPLQSYHPMEIDGHAVGFGEELYARDPVMPSVMPEDSIQYLAKPGSVVFLPRGWWHETAANGSCFAVNIVFKGMTWSNAIANAIVERMHGDATCRGYVSGMLPSNGSVVERSRAHFEVARQSAMRALAELRFEDACISGTEGVFQWTSSATGRRVELVEGANWLVCPFWREARVEFDGDLLRVVEVLVALTHPFRWSHVVATVRLVQPEMPLAGVWNLLTDLVDLELLLWVTSDGSRRDG